MAQVLTKDLTLPQPVFDRYKQVLKGVTTKEAFKKLEKLKMEGKASQKAEDDAAVELEKKTKLLLDAQLKYKKAVAANHGNSEEKAKTSSELQNAKMFRRIIKSALLLVEHDLKAAVQEQKIKDAQEETAAAQGATAAVRAELGSQTAAAAQATSRAAASEAALLEMTATAERDRAQRDRAHEREQRRRAIAEQEAADATAAIALASRLAQNALERQRLDDEAESEDVA